MILKVKANASLKCLSLEMLREIVANVTVAYDCNVKPVTFSSSPPADTTVLWQQTDGCGGAHLGAVKSFQNGRWA